MRKWMLSMKSQATTHYFSTGISAVVDTLRECQNATPKQEKFWREKRAEKLSFFVFWWGENRGGTTTPPLWVLCALWRFLGLQGVSLAPRRAPCFDAKCQNTYGVTLVKSNRTFYHKFQMNQKKGGISVMGKVSMPQGKESPCAVCKELWRTKPEFEAYRGLYSHGRSQSALASWLCSRGSWI